MAQQEIRETQYKCGAVDTKQIQYIIRINSTVKKLEKAKSKRKMQQRNSKQT